MTIAVPPDPFEEEWHALIGQLEDLDTGGFGYTDPDVIEREVQKFHDWLASTPTAEK